MENQTRELARKDESLAKKQQQQTIITLEAKFKLNGSGIRAEME